MLEELAHPPPEVRLQGGERQVAAVRGLVDPVAGERARQGAGEPGELVRLVGHRDDDVRPAARPPALEQRCQDAQDGRQRARGEIRDR